MPKTSNIISATLSSHYFPHARHHGQVLRNFQRTRQNDILQGKLFIISLPEMHGICRMCATLSEGKDGNRSAKFVSPACSLHQSLASSRLKFQIILFLAAGMGFPASWQGYVGWNQNSAAHSCCIVTLPFPKKLSTMHWRAARNRQASCPQGSHTFRIQIKICLRPHKRLDLRKIYAASVNIKNVFKILYSL